MQKKIKLSNGSFLDVFITPMFLERIKSYFDLQSISEVQDDHIRRFIYGAVDNAVVRAETDLKNSS